MTSPVRKIFLNGASRRDKSLTGFTLIELLSVIIILSVFIVISLPSLANTARNFYFRNKVKQVESLLWFIKKLSLTEQRTYQVRLNPNTNTLEVLKAGTEDKRLKLKKVHDSMLRSRFLGKDVFFKTRSDHADILNTQSITFNADGSLSHSEFYIYDKNNHGAKFITTLSGQIILNFI